MPPLPDQIQQRPGHPRTQLTFTQDYARELSDEVYGIYNYNWGYYLESLKQYCETGRGKPYAAD